MVSRNKPVMKLNFEPPWNEPTEKYPPLLNRKICLTEAFNGLGKCLILKLIIPIVASQSINININDN